MRRVWLVVLAVMAVLLQLTWLPALRPLGIVPNLALVVVVLVGLEGTASIALVLAVACGLVLDMGSGSNFGLWTVTLVLAALGAGFVHRAGVELGGSVVSMALVAAGTVLMSVVILLGLVPVVSYWPWGDLVTGLVVQLVINLLLTIGLRPVVRWSVAGPSQLGTIG